MRTAVVTILTIAGCTAGGKGTGSTDTPASTTTGAPGGSTAGSPTGPVTGGATSTGTPSGTTSGTTTTGGCVAAIPGTAAVIASAAPANAPGDYWVCPGGVLSFTGSGATIYVEDLAELVLNGSGNTVYVKAVGETVLFADGNAFTFEPGAVVNPNPAANLITVCPVVTFDLAAAPLPGC